MIIDANNRIVAGHGRVEAAKRAGLTDIATLRIDHLSDAELRLYALQTIGSPSDRRGMKPRGQNFAIYGSKCLT